jgi:hypothetical protein
MGLFRPNPDGDERCKAETKWVREYRPSEDVPGAFVLEHAKYRLAESVAAFESLSSSASEFLKIGGMLATIECATIAAMHVNPSWWLRASLCFFLASMLASLHSRQPVDFSTSPQIRGVLENAAKTKNCDAWLAASLHEVVEANRVVNRWKSAWLRTAGWLIVTGVGLLLPTLFSL